MTRREEFLFVAFSLAVTALFGDPLFFAGYAAVLAALLLLSRYLAARRRRALDDLVARMRGER